MEVKKLKLELILASKVTHTLSLSLETVSGDADAELDFLFQHVGWLK